MKYSLTRIWANFISYCDEGAIFHNDRRSLFHIRRIDELSQEFDTLIDDHDAVIFVCMVDGNCIGFAQCQLRHDYVEGTDSSPVGYLEGVYIEEGSRNQGYGKMLINACEQWAKEKGCVEFASDCEWDNHNSRAFHLHTGFQEANRIICFIKKL